MWPGSDAHMGWMGLWGLVGLGLLVLVLWATMQAGRSSSAGTDDSPETILKRRYARGEIDREAYDRALTDLRK